MSTLIIENTEQDTTATCGAFGPTLWVRVVLTVGICIALLSLLGIVYFYIFHQAQNQAVLTAYSDVMFRDQAGPPTIPELITISHEACVLQIDLSGIASFLQPVTASVESGGWCGNYARVFILLAQANGLKAHKLHLRSGERSHTMAEVYADGKWRAVDPFFNLYYRLPSGEMATFDDIYRTPGLSRTPHKVGAVADPRLELIYTSYIPIWPGLFRDSGDLDWALDQSSIYHSGILLLNYPLSLFYDGQRRAVIPNCLDRPEFLAIYLLSGVFLTTSGSMAIWLYRAEARRQQIFTKQLVTGGSDE